MEKILAGGDEVLEILREQYKGAVVTERWVTGMTDTSYRKQFGKRLSTGGRYLNEPVSIVLPLSSITRSYPSNGSVFSNPYKLNYRISSPSFIRSRFFFIHHLIHPYLSENSL